ncbi:general stress protein [Laspinema sp. A4]|uniref:general stress protein n=1 Tax=Laspinema sp. D2d TaxID=2953686 RepID=UPI0021BBAF1C|nr:general stress protein [Laspinema sp. D2d]MCT7986437.1 general stress protein [Laspinema sp. D2d]
MSLLVQKRAIGVFEDSQSTENALKALREAGFSMDNILVATQDNIPPEMESPDSEFLENRTVEGLGKGVMNGTVFGAIAGLFSGLTTLFLPGLGPISVVGPVAAIAGLTAAGSFYGALGGAIVGTIAGDKLTEGQANIYHQHLTQGHYLVRLEGTEEEITQAESILRQHGIQEWQLYESTDH